MTHATMLSPAESALLVVDVQEKLISKIHGSDRVVKNAGFLLDVAKALGVEILATEQYPKGLGSTVAELLPKLPANRPDKVGFSCCAVPTLIDDLRKKDIFRVVLVGIEAHVCVLHTALDLIAEDFFVYLPVDAIGSRYPIDCEYALRRLEGSGAVLTTVETIAFEWMGGSNHPKFKEVSGLIQERMKWLGAP